MSKRRTSACEMYTPHERYTKRGVRADPNQAAPLTQKQLVCRRAKEREPVPLLSDHHVGASRTTAGNTRPDARRGGHHPPSGMLS
eukprot:2297949-Prymnesium_polylepis.1